jgi:hypothetical protein
MSGFLAPDNHVDAVFTFCKGLHSHAVLAGPKSTLLLGVWMSKDSSADPITTEVKSISSIYNSYRVTPGSEAEVLSLGIDSSNAKDYRYHVVEDDSIEIVPWSPVPLSKHFGATTPFGFLGRFHRPGYQLLFEVQNIHRYAMRDGVILDWSIHFQPRLTDMQAGTSRNWYQLNPHKYSQRFVSRFEPQTGVPLDLRFPQDTVEALEIDLAHHETQPYEITITKQGDSVAQQMYWWFLGETFKVQDLYFKKPGKYTLDIRAIGTWSDADTSTILAIPFEVYPPTPANRKYSLAQISGYAAGFILVFAVLFFLYYFRNKRHLETSLREKQLATLQLKSIRSQLNPHFMFNALSSIQSLMNREEVGRARHFLSTFAGLTRKVLLAGDQELISLEDEIQILDDYLKMEQLRFGFVYALDIMPDLPIANIDVPSMLLQPYVENAVKHGVSPLGAAGMIQVSVLQSGRDLVLRVQDNGSGFDAGVSGSRRAFGLKLGADRIALLNKIYKDQSARLAIDSGSTGTVVTIRLSNWI